MSKYILIISKIKPINQQAFKVADLTDIEVNFSADSNVLYVDGNTLASSGITWQDSELYCNILGDLHINGSLFLNSDRKLKKNIIKISNALDTLNRVNGVLFLWRLNNKKDYGVIAQLLLKILPEMVSLNNRTGLKQVSYIKLIPFLMEAIKLLHLRITYLLNKQITKESILQRLIMKIKSLWEKIM